MNWGTFLAVLLGGAVTIAAQVVQGWSAGRAEARRRSDRAAETLRKRALSLLEVERDFPQTDRILVSSELDEHLERKVYPEMTSEIGYLRNRRLRSEMRLLLRCLERWLAIRDIEGDLPATMRWRIAQRMDEVLSAHVRHDLRRLAQPSWVARYQAALNQQDEWDAEQAAAERAYRLELAAERRAAIQVPNQSDAEEAHRE